MACECTWDSLVKWVMPFVMSADDEHTSPPTGLLKAFVRRVAYDFAVRSGSLRKTEYYDLNCGVKDYPIEIDETLVNVWKVKINGEDVDKDMYYFQDDVLYLESNPKCDIEGGLAIEYSYAPCTEGTCDVPEELCTHYREAIINGALSHLLAMPHMDWYSATESKRYSDMYERSISRSKTSARKLKGGRRGNICDIRTKFIQ